MEKDRGVSTVTVIVVILIVLGGGYFLFHGAASPAKAAPMSTAAEDTGVGAMPIPTAIIVGEVMPTPPPLASLVRVDSNLFKDNYGVYAQSAGNAGTYVKLAVPNAGALVRIFPASSSRPPAGAASAPGVTTSLPVSTDDVAIYTDQNQVYALTNTTTVGGGGGAEATSDVPAGTPVLSPLSPADPSTFVLLANDYAKDSQNVYILKSVCDAHGTCTEVLQIVVGADPATFNAFAPSTIQSSTGSGIIVIDAIDTNNAYFTGTIVDVAPSANTVRKLLGVPDENGLILLAP